MTLAGFPPWVLAMEGAIIGFLIALPVGPAAILCIRRTISSGFAAGFVTGVGAAAGDAVFGGVAAFGLSFVAEFIARHEAWIRGLGGAAMCAMGWSYMRHKPPSIGDPVAADRAHPYLTQMRFLLSSFAITVFNPITVMAFGAVFASRGLSKVGGDLLAATLLITTVFAGALAWWALLCGISYWARVWFSGGGLTWLNRGAGCALAAFGLVAMVSLLPLDWKALGLS